MNEYAIPGDWASAAACRGATARMAMARETGHDARRRNSERNERAKAICATCPVLDECRQWALTSPDPAEQMIAGGLTPDERFAARTGARRRRSGDPRVPCDRSAPFLPLVLLVDAVVHGEADQLTLTAAP